MNPITPDLEHSAGFALCTAATSLLPCQTLWLPYNCLKQQVWLQVDSPRWNPQLAERIKVGLDSACSLH